MQEGTRNEGRAGRVKVGERVGLPVGGRVLMAEVVEDRGDLGAQGQQVVRLAVQEQLSGQPFEVEVPVSWLKPAPSLLEDMLRLGHGHDWDAEVRRKYEGMTQEQTRAQLGKPDRELRTVRNEPVDEYFVDKGFLDLRFHFYRKSNTWKLAGCHLG